MSGLRKGSRKEKIRETDEDTRRRLAVPTRRPWVHSVDSNLLEWKNVALEAGIAWLNVLQFCKRTYRKHALALSNVLIKVVKIKIHT